MQNFGLSKKILVLFVATLLACVAVLSIHAYNQQKEQAEASMLQDAMGVASTMDAVWEFMERNQNQFVLNSDGTRRLYCVVAAKAVALIVTQDNDYSVHYTNTETRRAIDAPDVFEFEALDTFLAQDDLECFYGLVENADGNSVFRYAQPLYIDESCLDCHGDPAGELDELGYVKEGRQVGDLAGIMSIVLPADGYLNQISSNVWSSILLTVVIISLALTFVFLVMRRFVTRPILAIDAAANEIEQANFDISLPKNAFARDELDDLASHLESMSAKLNALYSDLEAEVGVRTEALTKANQLLKEQSAELTLANEKIQNDSQERIRFLSVMSHELRTPLTSILAFISIWQEKHEARDDEEAMIMRELAFNSQQLLSLVNNILEISRKEARRTRVEYEDIDMMDLVNLMAGTMSSLANRKDISLHCNVERSTPIIWADRDKLLRILENLVSNAIKYNAPNGNVWVDVRGSVEDDGVDITVVDDGIGIQESELSRIFDSFYQVGGVSSFATSGSGLGLAVVKELVELHGGSITVESSYKKGTTFKVFIPSHEASD